MRVTFQAEWQRKKRGHRITEVLRIDDSEAMTWGFVRAVEVATLLHGLADAKLHKMREDPKTTGRGFRAHADSSELGDNGAVLALVDAVLEASKVTPNPAIERVRTLMRATLVPKFAQLGIRQDV